MAIVSSQVDSSNSLIPPGATGPIPSVSASLIYEDMNVSTGGVARDTNIGSTFTTIYDHSGSGLMFGFNLSLEDPDEQWYLRLIIDGNDIFIGSSGIYLPDMYEHTIYSLSIDASNDNVMPFCGLLILNGSDGNIRWTAPNGYPVSFTSSIEIQVRKEGDTDAFYAGLVCRS